MRTVLKISDFKFHFDGYGHYTISFFSPKTGKEWKRKTNDMQIVDEFKGSETSDHTKKRLNWLKNYVKNN